MTAFYVAAAIALAATLLVITSRNAVHALLYLVVSLLAVAVVFYLLGATFVAALEVIIYAGAIMVLFIFVVMLLDLGEVGAEDRNRLLRPATWIGPGLLAAALLVEVVLLLDRTPTGGGWAVAPDEVGAALFGPYAVAVELAAMLLLAGLVGAFHLGRRHVVSRPADSRPREVSRPPEVGR